MTRTTRTTRTTTRTTRTTSRTRTTTVDSPVGPLTLTGADGVLTGLYMADQRHRPDLSQGAPDPRGFDQAVEQLTAYFRGELRSFTVPLAPVGTPFQQRVWAALREVPYGTTTSYGALAASLGAPGAARAVGLANGRNPIGIVVPCHRVVGATGLLTGYGGGLARKQWLLDHECGGVLPLGV